MPFIDETYFNREVLVPGVESPVVSGPLCKFIAEYEPRFLEKAFGYAFAKALLAGAAVTPPAAKWTEIVTGGEYTVNGVLKKWHGLKQPTIKESIIANYVYFYYMRNEVSQTSRMGEVAATTENAGRETPGYKMAKAWNDMVDQVHLLWEFLKYKTDDNGAQVYTDFIYRQVDCRIFKHINTFGI